MKLKKSVIAVLGSIVLATMIPSVASAAPNKVDLGAGSGFGIGTLKTGSNIPSKADHCTIAAVGRDLSGALVALTAAHCVMDGNTGNLIPLMKDGVKIGQFESAHITVPVDFSTGSFTSPSALLPGKYDFAFARLDESLVNPISERGADISKGLLAPGQTVPFLSEVCKSGITSGKTCGGYVGEFGKPGEHNAMVNAQPGDSGGPFYTADGYLVGITSRKIPNYWTDVREASDYAASQGWLGGGFTPIA